ncbi:hypothetical protein [Demetria terragena]|uniref:hypothetical protein n=1 Tax=Demetria terragena TaxID=63959 RepID=UPI00037F3B22|nr:hypothetical protein [Demetria terragena]
MSPPRTTFRLRVATSGATGFVDLVVCCLLIARTGVAIALGAGILGAVGFAATSAFLRRRREDQHDGEDLADRMERVSEEVEDHIDESRPDPLLVRWGLNVVLALGWLVFSILTVAAGSVRTIVVVVLFGSLTPAVRVADVVIALGVCIGLAFALHYLVFEPIARRHGVEL